MVIRAALTAIAVDMMATLEAWKAALEAAPGRWAGGLAQTGDAKGLQAAKPVSRCSHSTCRSLAQMSSRRSDPPTH